MGKIWRHNGLSLTLAALFLACLSGQILFGQAAYNEELAREGAATLGLRAYLASGHFASALFENWESEFLQLGMYVVLTVHLRQRGSAESRPVDDAEEEGKPVPGSVPWPVRAGGLWLRFYEWSLSVALLVLFAAAFVGHALGSWRTEAAERLHDGRPPQTFVEHVTGAEFWFESMQNWQSEFMAVLSLVLLSIVLRQKNSPQSKPVEAPHSQTGT